jgi:predicted Zn finger-like uncharacterized protein
MIIQCPKCETQYRFDESLIEGDGVWVRCSRCQHVFFQIRPSETGGEAANEVPSIRISDAKRAPDDRLPPESESFAKPESYSEILDASRTAEPPAAENEPVVNFQREFLTKVVEEKEEQTIENDEEPSKRQKKRRRWIKGIFEVIAILIFIAIVAGAVFLYIYPDVRNDVWGLVSPSLKGIPFFEKVIPESSKKEPEKVSKGHRISEEMLIKDMRLRTAPNIIAGNLQVIEGTVVNQTPFPIAKIKMRLVITDAYDVVLRDKYFYCGNILTDEEIGTLTETEIQRELSNPQGSDFSNERIAPNGVIPFMIVYTQDKQEVVKTSVTVAGYERPAQ